jgi:hypothetical protein
MEAEQLRIKTMLEQPSNEKNELLYYLARGYASVLLEKHVIFLARPLRLQSGQS